MSLKITHVFLIILSIGLTIFLSYQMSISNNEYSTILSIGGVVSSLGLAYYLYSIIKKFRMI